MGSLSLQTPASFLTVAYEFGNSAEIARIEQKLFEQQTGTESSADSNSRSPRSFPCARSSRCFASRGGIHWSF